MNRIRIASRSSLLAMAQCRLVAEAIRRVAPDVDVTIAPMTTPGDRRRGPLAGAGGKGLFTAELEDALRRGRVDLAVHSAKDLPAAMPDDLTIAAVPPREDPRDALAAARPLALLPSGATVGTGSLRRAALLRAARPDVQATPLRGNVETRLARVLDGKLDAVVMAMAGLLRSGLARRHANWIHPLPAETFIPAAGQAALAVQAAAGRGDVLALLRPLDDAAARAALEAERSVVASLGASCHSCLAVHVACGGAGWRGWAMAARPDGADMQRFEACGPSAAAVGEALRGRMRNAGVEGLLG